MEYWNDGIMGGWKREGYRRQKTPAEYEFNSIPRGRQETAQKHRKDGTLEKWSTGVLE